MPNIYIIKFSIIRLVGISIQSIIAALLILEESLLHLLKLRETIQETMSQSNSVL